MESLVKNEEIKVLEYEYHIPNELKYKFTLWFLRVILKLNSIDEFVDNYGHFRQIDVACFLGLSDFVNDKKKFSIYEVIRLLKQQLIKLEKQKDIQTSQILNKNIKKISSLMQLNTYEEQILEFTILLNQYDMLDDVVRFLGNNLNTNQIKKYLSIILDIPHSEIENSFKADSKLIKSSLITIYKKRTGDFKDKLQLISDEFADNISSFDEDIEFMLKEIVSKCDDSNLSLSNFNHLEKNTSILIPYLKSALTKKAKGVNILFYGVAGTGKTELTKVITKYLGKTLFEISYNNEDNEPIDGKNRLNAYRSAQSLFSNKDVLFMFDEIEDVFNSDSNLSRRQENKAWINRILENNSIPTFWITNDIYSIDKAIIRRFDMAIEIPVPKKKKRVEILKQATNNSISEKTISKLAKLDTIAPALVTRAMKVTSSLETKNNDKAFEVVINNTLKAQGYQEISSKKKDKKQKDALPNSYDPSLINTSTDLKKLTNGIEQSKNARLCLYGPAGTGKSAYAKYIAKKLNKKLIIKKGSDLISKWLGETEQNIAKAFKEAKDKKAVLVFDEVDSFLSDRNSSQRSWEVTQVNEMLVQMENFDGIFVATTNLMDNLDKASLRRFDLKLEFSFLQKEQAWNLFKSECKNIGLENISSSLKEDISTLRYLTPGDFAAVLRQNRFNPINDANDFINRLKDEVEVKALDSGKTMGFL